MKIPTDQETPEAFIERVAALLERQDTHVYFDTNVLMWVTLLSSSARQEFLALLNSVQARAHVPTWAMNEFYRLHRDNYLEKQLHGAAEELKQSVKDFAEQAEKYKGQTPIADLAFIERLDRVRKDIAELGHLAEAWQYQASALETLEWMNSIACSQGNEFEILSELKRIGAARYSHEIPPGYRDNYKKARSRKQLESNRSGDKDDDKKTRKQRGSNHFGDLLLWQEVLSHATAVEAKTVIVVTNDRKDDWYFDQGEPRVSPGLRRLGVRRWSPVPSPHPLLPFELQSKCGADLVLIDHLYLGATAWHLDKKRFAFSLGRRSVFRRRKSQR